MGGRSCWPGRHGPPGQLYKISVGLGRLELSGVCCSFISALGTETLEVLAMMRILFMAQTCLSIKLLDSG